MNWPLHRSPLKSSTAATEASSNQRVVVRGQRQNHQPHSLKVVPFKGAARHSRRVAPADCEHGAVGLRGIEARFLPFAFRTTVADGVRGTRRSHGFSSLSANWPMTCDHVFLNFKIMEYLLDVIGVWKAVQSDMESRDLTSIQRSPSGPARGRLFNDVSTPICNWGGWQKKRGYRCGDFSP